MIHIKKIAYSILLAGVLFSCGKDEIEVIKNLDTSWSVDQSVIDADIRTRIGYDPRYNYVFTKNTDFEFPMLSLGGFTITGQTSTQITVQLVKPLEKDVTVALTYSTDLYEKIKDKYSGYNLGTEGIVSVEAQQKVITKGETSVSFAVTVNNNSSFQEQVILPYALSVVDEDNIKLVDSFDKVVFKVFPKDVRIDYPKRFELSMVISDSNIYSSQVPLEIGISDVVNDPITFSLEKDTSLSLNAPEGMEGILPTDVDIRGVSSKSVLLNIDKSNLDLGETYRLPLKIVLKQGAKTYELAAPIDVFVSAVSDAENAFASTQKTGTKVSKRDLSVAFSKSVGYSNEINDDNYTDYNYAMINNVPITMEVSFTKREVSSFVMSIFKTVRPSSTEVYAVDDSGNEVYQGTVTFDASSTEVAVNFKNAVTTNKLIFKNLTGTGSNGRLYVREIDVYETN